MMPCMPRLGRSLFGRDALHCVENHLWRARTRRVPQRSFVGSSALIRCDHRSTPSFGPMSKQRAPARASGRRSLKTSSKRGIQETEVTVLPEVTSESIPFSSGTDGRSNGAIPANWVQDEQRDRSDPQGSYGKEYEGCEKTLEVCFRPRIVESVCSDSGATSKQPVASRSKGLRLLTRRDLDILCNQVRCEILSSVSNEHLDAYVLSESSLFVYPNVVVIKTCGTTTLLRCVATLIDMGKRLGLELDWIGYSRKNYLFPMNQVFPHQSFAQEMQYLRSHQKLSQRLQGKGYTLGPVDADHWLVFVGNRTKRSHLIESGPNIVVNIMMFDIDRRVAEMFYYDKYESQGEGEQEEEFNRRISDSMTKASGIDSLCTEALVDSKAFKPCGYSMNSILESSYSTVHVTPEDGSSYASYETNENVTSYEDLLEKVVAIFKPERFVVTLIGDSQDVREVKMNPITCTSRDSKFEVSSTGSLLVYKRREIASLQGEEDACYMMGNWDLDTREAAVHVRRRDCADDSRTNLSLAA